MALGEHDFKQERTKSMDTIDRIEEETNNFIADHLRLFKEMWERERAFDELSVNVEKLHAKSTAFSRSIKAANSRLRNKYIKNVMIAFALVLIVLIFFKMV